MPLLSSSPLGGGDLALVRQSLVRTNEAKTPSHTHIHVLRSPSQDLKKGREGSRGNRLVVNSQEQGGASYHQVEYERNLSCPRSLRHAEVIGSVDKELFSRPPPSNHRFLWLGYSVKDVVKVSSGNIIGVCGQTTTDTEVYRECVCVCARERERVSWISEPDLLYISSAWVSLAAQCYMVRTHTHTQTDTSIASTPFGSGVATVGLKFSNS